MAADPFAKIVATAWSDDGYKARLIADPAAVLAEAGLEPDPDITVKVVEDTPTKRTLVLRVAPAEGELSEESLDTISAGASCYTGGCFCF